VIGYRLIAKHSFGYQFLVSVIGNEKEKGISLEKEKGVSL